VAPSGAVRGQGCTPAHPTSSPAFQPPAAHLAVAGAQHVLLVAPHQLVDRAQHQLRGRGGAGRGRAGRRAAAW
jgi:hypothetical protein